MMFDVDDAQTLSDARDAILKIMRKKSKQVEERVHADPGRTPSFNCSQVCLSGKFQSQTNVDGKT